MTLATERAPHGVHVRPCPTPRITSTWRRLGTGAAWVCHCGQFYRLVWDSTEPGPGGIGVIDYGAMRWMWRAVPRSWDAETTGEKA